MLEEDPRLAPSLAQILATIGSRAAGQILVALGRGPLRTKQLTERVSTCAPRTVYRHAAKLVELGVVERVETGGVPSMVVHRLDSGSGRELLRLLEISATRMDARGRDRRIEDDFWTAVALLGEMWETGWFELLGRAAFSPTQLSELTPGLSFHQSSRRGRLLCCHGLLRVAGTRGRGTRYQLAARARRGAGLLAALACWRGQHLLESTEKMLTVDETAAILRASLPLVQLPQHPGIAIKLGIVGSGDVDGGTGAAAVAAKVARNGAVRCIDDLNETADGWALATVDSWLRATVKGTGRRRVRIGGEEEVVQVCLTALHDLLRGSVRPADRTPPGGPDMAARAYGGAD